MCDCENFDPANAVLDYAGGHYTCTACACVLKEVIFEDAIYARDHVHHVRHVTDDALIPSYSGHHCHKKRYLAEPDPHKNARRGFRDLEVMGRVLGLSEDHRILTAAKEVYKDVVAKKPAREDTRAAFAACSLYFGCKLCNVSRTLKEIRELCGPVDLHGTIKTFKDVLQGAHYYDALFKMVSSEDLITRVVGALQGLDQVTRRSFERSVRDIQTAVSFHNILEGKTPEGVLSGIMALAAERLGLKQVTKKAISEACNVTSVTLNKTYKKLQQDAHV